jgi:hypothetical protein
MYPILNPDPVTSLNLNLHLGPQHLLAPTCTAEVVVLIRQYVPVPNMVSKSYKIRNFFYFLVARSAVATVFACFFLVSTSLGYACFSCSSSYRSSIFWLDTITCSLKKVKLC